MKETTMRSLLGFCFPMGWARAPGRCPEPRNEENEEKKHVRGFKR
uniref:Uncharacterized protein n=1 Tax=Anguilla anguilla TaxID=7936 RepID=A0A0E9UC95_ANGAN